MAEYQIFSDGACDIGFAKAKELGIGLIPFYISIDHETYYKEIQEISLEEYFRYMTEEKGYPKTSLPSIQDYMDAFRPALEAGKDIICITMTRTLTASLESAVTAKSMLEEEFPHVQFNTISNEVLKDAQAHPENYRDLLVRVAGYSTQFVNLSKSMQDSIMARNAHEEF